MKRLLSLILMSAILIFAMSASPIKKSPVKNHHKKTLVDVYLNNGTAWVATANIGGNIFSEGPEDCGEVGSISTGTYNVTLSTTAPGSHQYLFTGQTTRISSTGSVTFTNVSVTGDVTAAVY